MSDISSQLVKDLRDRTGVGVGKCKEALVEAKGDIELAIANLRKAGIASAVKKESRETNEGKITSAENSSAVAIVEINAETDFVVKNEGFQDFSKAIAQQICETAPAAVSDLLKQSCAKDRDHTVDEYRAITMQKLGENIQIKRFKLFPKSENLSIGVYSHAEGKLVTLIEIEGSNQEVALAKEIAMHVAAESPDYLSPSEVPASVLENEKDIASAQVKNKPDNIVAKIVEGKLNAYFNQACLLNQPFIKDSSLTVGQVVEARAKECGKQLKVRQFLRWRVGE